MSATRLTSMQAGAFARDLMKRAERSGDIERMLPASDLESVLDLIARRGGTEDVIVEVRPSAFGEGLAA